MGGEERIPPGGGNSLGKGLELVCAQDSVAGGEDGAELEEG